MNLQALSRTKSPPEFAGGRREKAPAIPSPPGSAKETSRKKSFQLLSTRTSPFPSPIGRPCQSRSLLTCAATKKLSLFDRQVEGRYCTKLPFGRRVCIPSSTFFHRRHCQRASRLNVSCPRTFLSTFSIQFFADPTQDLHKLWVGPLKRPPKHGCHGEGPACSS